MKKYDIPALLPRLLTPVALMVLGLVLLLSPDTASAVTAKILGWCLLGGAVCFVVAAISSPFGTVSKVLMALVCAGSGAWLLRNPLLLAAGLGRFVGIVLLIRGVQDFFGDARTRSRLGAGLVAGLGVVLIAMPMTTSRLVFSGCGLVLLILDIGVLIDRLRDRPNDDRPDIIDAL